MKVKTSKGFTLAELLIVMAIIVVLAAVAIPTFGKQLETSRETGDMEIIRNAYTEALSIATLDGADGKLNGKFGDGSDTGDTGSWGAVSIAASSDITAPSTTATSQAKYTVTLNGATAPAVDMSAYFSQAKSTLTGTNLTPANTWKYVNPTLAGHTVPIVDATKTKLTFQFEITGIGDVQLVADTADVKAINAE